MIKDKLQPNFKKVVSSHDEFLNRYKSREMRRGIDTDQLSEFSEWPLKQLLELDGNGGHYAQLDVEAVFKDLSENSGSPTKLQVMKIIGKAQLVNIANASRDWAYVTRVMLNHINLKAWVRSINY